MKRYALTDVTRGTWDERAVTTAEMVECPAGDWARATDAQEAEALAGRLRNALVRAGRANWRERALTAETECTRLRACNDALHAENARLRGLLARLKPAHDPQHAPPEQWSPEVRKGSSWRGIRIEG